MKQSVLFLGSLLVVLFITFGVIGLNSYYSTVETAAVAEVPIIAELTPSGAVTLSLTPTDINTAPNQETTVSLRVNSGNSKLTAVNFEISYDESKLNVSNLSLGSWLTQPLVSPTIENGKISGILGANPDPDVENGGPELNRTGEGTLLTFKVKPASYGTFFLTIVESISEAAVMGVDTNSLKAVSGATVSSKLKTDLVGTDHKVDLYDYAEFIRQYGSEGTADFNGVNGVDIYDYAIFIADYGKTW